MRYLFQVVLITICTFQMVKISGQTVQMVSRMSMLIMNILKAQATTVVSLLRTVMLTCTVKKFKKLMQSKQFLDITI